MIGRTGLAAAPLLVLLLGCGRAVAAQYDVVVYGGTAGGVMAAIAAANLGVRVALLEPGRHVGGMISGGLGRPIWTGRNTSSVVTLANFSCE